MEEGNKNVLFIVLFVFIVYISVFKFYRVLGKWVLKGFFDDFIFFIILWIN